MSKNVTRIHHQLSNGQWASLYLRCDKRVLFDDDIFYDCWYAGFRIGNVRRANNDWWEKPKKHQGIHTTGKCGLEGMIFAKKTLLEFMEKREKDAPQKLILGHQDSRRERAYRYMLKYGFSPGTYFQEEAIIKEF